MPDGVREQVRDDLEQAVGIRVHGLSRCDADFDRAAVREFEAAARALGNGGDVQALDVQPHASALEPCKLQEVVDERRKPLRLRPRDREELLMLLLLQL